VSQKRKRRYSITCHKSRNIMVPLEPAMHFWSDFYCHIINEKPVEKNALGCGILKLAH